MDGDAKGCSRRERKMTFDDDGHGIALDLGIITKNNVVSDQTPTPTRFIRNCEELGLFQDLQNVNPFEETFKKALEQTKNGVITTMTVAQPDDTLHTPHILPHITPNIAERETRPFIDVDEPEFPILEISEDEDTANSNNSCDRTEKETGGNNVNSRLTLMNSIRMMINKPKNGVKSNRIISNKEERRIITTSSNTPVDSKIAKKRELNRLAQLRSRLRKKRLSQETDKQMQELRDENNRLMAENRLLRSELEQIKTMILRHDCPIQENSCVPVINPVKKVSSSSNERAIMPKVDCHQTVIVQPGGGQIQWVSLANGESLKSDGGHGKAVSLIIHNGR